MSLSDNLRETSEYLEALLLSTKNHRALKTQIGIALSHINFSDPLEEDPNFQALLEASSPTLAAAFKRSTGVTKLPEGTSVQVFADPKRAIRKHMRHAFEDPIKKALSLMRNVTENVDLDDGLDPHAKRFRMLAFTALVEIRQNLHTMDFNIWKLSDTQPTQACRKIIDLHERQCTSALDFMISHMQNDEGYNEELIEKIKSNNRESAGRERLGALTKWDAGNEPR